jgi:hypothetical protein
MSDWKDLIPEGFGPVLVLAGTPAESAKVGAPKAELVRTPLPRSLVEHTIEDWLRQETSNTSQALEATARVRGFLGS